MFIGNMLEAVTDAKGELNSHWGWGRGGETAEAMWTVEVDDSGALSLS